MALEERLLDAVLDLTKEVHSMGTKIDDKIALLIDANKLKEEEQDGRIEKVEEITKTVAPIAKIIRNKEYILIGIFLVTALTGASLGQLAIIKLNKTTGLDTISESVKKNTKSIKRLCDYLGLDEGIE